MKILHVVHGYAPAVGGTQWVVQNLSERLVSRYGDDVTVFTTVAYSNAYFWDRSQPAMAPGVEQINGVTVRRFPVFNRWGWLRLNLARVAHRLRLPGEDWLRGLYFGPLIPGMTDAIARSGADVVMASAFPLLHMHYAQWGGERAGVPTVLIGALHPVDRWCFDRPVIYRTIRRSSAYVAYTDFEREYLLQRDVPPEKITVMGGGVDPDLYRRADGARTRELHGWGAAPVVVTIAQHWPHKRIDLLIRAMARVWQRFPKAVLAIAGRRTAYTPQLERMIQELARTRPDKADQIVILGQVSQQEKADLLAACDVLALPSSHESFGLVFLEAWVCGKPVIGARIGAVSSVIDEGVDGLLSTYGDIDDLARAINALLADPARRRRMGQAGRQKVLDRYTWDVVTRQLRDLYSQLVTG